MRGLEGKVLNKNQKLFLMILPSYAMGNSDFRILKKCGDMIVG